MVQRLIDKHKIYLAYKCIIFQIFVDIDYLLNYIELKLLQLLQDSLLFSPFFVLPISCFALSNNFIVFGVCNSSLYWSFILNSNSAGKYWSPECHLKILFDHPRNVAIWRLGDVLKWRPGDILIWRSRDAPGRLIVNVPRTFSGRRLEDLQSTS